MKDPRKSTNTVRPFIHRPEKKKILLPTILEIKNTVFHSMYPFLIPEWIQESPPTSEKCFFEKCKEPPVQSNRNNNTLCPDLCMKHNKQFVYFLSHQIVTSAGPNYDPTIENEGICLADLEYYSSIRPQYKPCGAHVIEDPYFLRKYKMKRCCNILDTGNQVKSWVTIKPYNLAPYAYKDGDTPEDRETKNETLKYIEQHPLEYQEIIDYQCVSNPYQVLIPASNGQYEQCFCSEYCKNVTKVWQDHVFEEWVRERYKQAQRMNTNHKTYKDY